MPEREARRHQAMLTDSEASCARGGADYKHHSQHHTAGMQEHPNLVAAWYLVELLILAATKSSPKPDSLIEFQRALPRLRIPQSAFIPRCVAGRRRALSLPKERSSSAV